jgi:hypothetical protein
MTTRKNYNSIVFLTTLSVYLGLVLVGAPVPVLAQAALTSRFEVKDRIEKRDDLDKNPDDAVEEKIQSAKFGNRVILDYAEVVSALLEASRQANPNGFSYEFETKSDTAGKLQLKRVRFTNLNAVEIDRWQIFHKINSESDKLFNFFPAQTSYDESNVAANFKLSDKEFTVESKFLQKDGSDVQELSSTYNASLERLRREIVNECQALILKHTEILAENNQFVIVTRLPRGSLDALLAKDSAK